MRNCNSACFALLDDCNATHDQPISRLYTHFSHQRICSDPSQWAVVCGEVATDLQTGLHAVILADYEWGARAQLGLSSGSGSEFNKEKDNLKNEDEDENEDKDVSAFRFLLFHKCTHLSRNEVNRWLARRDADGSGSISPTPAGVVDISESISEREFANALREIRAALYAGDCYQINYTYRLNFLAFGSPVALYRRLRARQPTRYGALIAQPEGSWIISCSPELFLRHQAGHLIACPMKGTASRAEDSAADSRAAASLAMSLKNRAENLMIVDLLRNDLGHIAKIGSVRVTKLFSVEPYPTVWQMTSTIEAQIDDHLPFAELIPALFPCGSVTGAPKHRAMQWIDALESTPRGIYTGAIGWLEAPKTNDAGECIRQCGDFCLSVAIRTITLAAPRADGSRNAQLGIGSAVVLDSAIADERAECALKADFLTKINPGFSLIETMYATREAGIRHLKRHWRRLRAAARRFDFRWPRAALYSLLKARIAALPCGVPCKLRLLIDKQGQIQLSSDRIKDRLAEPVHVLLASQEAEGFARIDTRHFWFRYKTTWRAHYDRALDFAKQRGAFDMLFFNLRGELTEGARSNVFVKLDGRWFTPPIASGLLPGVMRAVLLNDQIWQATEKVLTLADLHRAQQITVCNALYGAVQAKMIEEYGREAMGTERNGNRQPE